MLGGVPLVTHSLRAALGAGVGPVVVVTSDPRVAATVEPPARVVRNDDPARGVSSSLHAAIRSARARTAALIVGLADQPLVGPAAYRRLAAAADGGADLAVATYGGVPGNPVLLGRAHFDEALLLTGDVGARPLLRRHAAVEVPCDGTGEPTDVDTPADLARLEDRWSGRAREIHPGPRAGR